MPSLPCTGEPRTGDSIPGVASSVQGGEWPLHLLAVPFLMQPTDVRCISHTFGFCIIHKPAENALGPIVQVIDEDVKEHWFQYQPLWCTTRD